MGCEEDIQRQINLAYTRNWQYSVFILIEFYSCFIIILFDIFIFMLILFSNQENLVKKKEENCLMLSNIHCGVGGRGRVYGNGSCLVYTRFRFARAGLEVGVSESYCFLPYLARVLTLLSHASHAAHTSSLLKASDDL